MNRLLGWIALVVAIAVAVVAVVELDQRADEDDQIAGPTVLPSPTIGATLRPATPSPTVAATATATATVDDVPATDVPTTSLQASPDETAAPAPTATAEPPATPNPSPTATPAPTVDPRGETPETGGGALLPGILIFAVAIAGRVILVRRP